MHKPAADQRSYLARVVAIGPDVGATDEGIQPLAHFVDRGGKDSVAVTLESNGHDDPYPVIYVRSQGAVKEHPLPPHPLLAFAGPEYEREASSALQGVLHPALSRSAE